jgi:oligopeptide/dipeptide ABC transporter ATP-binding protein
VHGGFWLQSPTFGKVFDDLTVSGVEIDIVEWPGAPVGGRNGTGRSRIVVVVPDLRKAGFAGLGRGERKPLFVLPGAQKVYEVLDLGQPLRGELLDLVKLPRAFAERMPRQLSGGQKQRVGIARAFAGGAKVVVADEPVSALDVSVQAAVTDLLMDIQRENKTTLLFISHDLSIVRYLSDRVLVMYLGHVVEMGTTDQVFQPPYHPYTEALLSAVPVADTKVIRKRIVLEGDIPSAMNPPPGCPFQTRCRWKSQVAGGLCDSHMPPVQTLTGGHQIKCHLGADVLAKMEPVITFAAE